jgi:hypothetical protein
MSVVVLVRATITAAILALDRRQRGGGGVRLAYGGAVRRVAARPRIRTRARMAGDPPQAAAGRRFSGPSCRCACYVLAPGEAAGRPLGTAAAAAADALQTADALQSWIVGRFWQAWRVLIWLACGGLLKPAARADTKGTLHNPTSPSTNPTARPLLDKFFRCAGRISAPWFGARGSHMDMGEGRKRLQVRTNRA